MKDMRTLKSYANEMRTKIESDKKEQAIKAAKEYQAAAQSIYEEFHYDFSEYLQAFKNSGLTINTESDSSVSITDGKKSMSVFKVDRNSWCENIRDYFNARQANYFIIAIDEFFS